jgi:multidrug transporter EmrE-like cation transporter
VPHVAVALVLGSSLLHALWNLLVKRAHDKLAFTALYLCTAPVLYLPMFLYLVRDASIPPAAWLCIAGTGLAYAGYFIGLALAYHGSELSVAYPLARGLGPMLAFLGGVLLLSEHPTMFGTVGVALILLAVAVLHRRAPSGQRGMLTPSLLAAVWVGLMYSVYSLIDKVAVGGLGVTPALYIYLTYTASACLVVPWTIRRQGVAALRAEWRANAAPCVAVAALNLFAYLIVLYAMSLPGTPVSYIVPLRTTSVLFGVLLGVGVLGEGRPLAKVSAALLMMAGIALMALRG